MRRPEGDLHQSPDHTPVEAVFFWGVIFDAAFSKPAFFEGAMVEGACLEESNLEVATSVCC